MDRDAVRGVNELPPCFQGVYTPYFRYFNIVQSEAFPCAFGSPQNMVLAAPMGSGKTGVMELAILGMLSANIDGDGMYLHRPGRLKAIYLAPSKALVQERVLDWGQKFGAGLNLQVLEVTGDSDDADPATMDAADIICTTPEKFDSYTRGGNRHGSTQFFGEIGLVLIDEVHLLNESRGSALEAGVIGRIKMVSRKKEMQDLPIGRVRFVAVSATIPNSGDLATWLGVAPQGLLTFGNEIRPVKLHTVVRGYAPTKTDFLFERRLDDFLPAIIGEYSSGQPSMIFCSSRKGTVDTAVSLAEKACRQGGHSIYVRDAAQRAQLESAAHQVQHKQLGKVLRAGVGFHYAAMEGDDRSTVERLFLDRRLAVLCTTSTLAVGVNLPARLVVLKGTRRWSGDGAGYKEYDRSSCLQMTGRAGRPQFDTHGVAVIMTQSQNVARYKSLAQGAEVLESQLKGQLAEYLNAEVVLLTITDIATASAWLRDTFLYVRMKANPRHYGLQPDLQGEAFEAMIREKLILSTASTLRSHDLVASDNRGFALHPTIPGQLMAHHYIDLQTMKVLLGIPVHASVPDLLTAVARSAEFSAIKLRRGEKKVRSA